MIDKKKLQRWYQFQAGFYSFWRDRYDIGILKDLSAEIDRLPHPSQILDLACGSGLFSIGVARRSRHGDLWLGIDFVQGLVKIAKRKAENHRLKELRFAVGDVETLPFKAGSFHAAIAGGLFPNLNSPENVLDELNRVLKRNGVFYIVEFASTPSLKMKMFIFCMVFAFNVFTSVFRQFRFSKDWSYEKTFVSAETVMKYLVEKRFRIEATETRESYRMIKAVRTDE
jgi:ubiquinone/menaquinone biosynthesis C-methylase UbiE